MAGNMCWEKKMKQGIVRSSSFALALALCSAAPALAQESAASEGESAGLEEIIVTAQKRSESIQKIPVTVSAFTAETIKNSGFSTVSELQGLVPGMTINRGQSAANLVHVSIRGIFVQDTGKAIEPGIGYLLDGVVIGAPSGLLVDSFDVDRIEVLRGPQGTLFGRNATGGALNVTRSVPDPSKDLSGRAKFTYGNFGRNDYEAVIHAPLVKDKLAVKLAFISQNDSGNIYNDYLNTHVGDKNVKDYNLTLRATPNDRFSATIIFEKMVDHSEAPGTINVLTPDLINLPIPGYTSGLNAPCFNPLTAFVCRPELDSDYDKVQHPLKQNSRLNLGAITVNLRHEFDTFALVSNFGFRDLRENNFTFLDSTELGYFPFVGDEFYKTLSQEVRFESNFGGKFEIIAGAMHFRSRYFIQSFTELDLASVVPTLAPGVALLAPAFPYRTDYHSRSSAIFAQAEYKFTDELKLIVGGRQTWDRKAIDVSLFTPGSGTALPLPIRPDIRSQGIVSQRAQDSAKFKKFTPKIAIQYQAAPSFMAFASYSVGYNTGGFNSRPPDIALIGPFKPETLDAYEIGFKSDWLDRRLRVNISAYYNQMKNKQEELTIVSQAVTGSATVNAAKASYTGVETEIMVAPIDGWNTSVAIGYMDAKYKSFAGDLGQGFRSDLTMLKLRRTPKWTVGAMTDYQFAAGPGTLGFNAGLTYTDKFETNIVNDPRGRIPATTKIDLSARYIFPVKDVEMKLMTFVKNVTNQHPYNGLFAGNAPGSNFAFAIPDPGRTWGVSLEVEF